MSSQGKNQKIFVLKGQGTFSLCHTDTLSLFQGLSQDCVPLSVPDFKFKLYASQFPPSTLLVFPGGHALQLAESLTIQEGGWEIADTHRNLAKYPVIGICAGAIVATNGFDNSTSKEEPTFTKEDTFWQRIPNCYARVQDMPRHPQLVTTTDRNQNTSQQFLWSGPSFTTDPHLTVVTYDDPAIPPLKAAVVRFDQTMLFGYHPEACIVGSKTVAEAALTKKPLPVTENATALTSNGKTANTDAQSTTVFWQKDTERQAAYEANKKIILSFLQSL